MADRPVGDGAARAGESGGSASGTGPASDARPGDHIVTRHRGLLRRTATVSVLTLLSRILGFVREVQSAVIFGAASPVYDAFLTAWRIPNLFRRLLGEGALATSLQNALTEEDARSLEAGRRLFLRTLAVTTGLLAVVCAGVVGLAWGLPAEIAGVRWLGEPEGAAAIRELTARVIPFVVLACLTALASGALNVRGHFALPAFGPVAMNAVWIATLAYLGLAMGGAEDLALCRVLAWGVLLAGAVQLALLVPALVRHGLLGRRGPPAGDPREERPRSAWRVLAASAPLALGAAVYQINVMIDGFMAEALLPTGAPTAHYLATRVQQFPFALIAVAATSSVFPSLKALGHLGRRVELRALHDRTQLAIAFLALPAGLGLLALAHPISVVLFQHGEFDARGASRVSAALAVLSLALLPAGAVGLASRVYYALDDLRTPVVVSSAMLVANTALNVFFVRVVGLGVEGLALGTLITTWGNFALLLPGLRRRVGPPADAAAIRAHARGIVLVSLGTGGAAWGAAVLARALGAGDGPGGEGLALAAGLIAGVAAFLALANALDLPEWAHLRARFARRG